MLEDFGVLVPPYSSDLNPIEFFAKVKSISRTSEHIYVHNDLETLLLMAILSVTPQDCQGWIRHAGFLLTFTIVLTIVY